MRVCYVPTMCDGAPLITSAMLKEGVEEFLSWDRLEDDPKQIVEAVFLAMQRTAPRLLSEDDSSALRRLQYQL